MKIFDEIFVCEIFLCDMPFEKNKLGQKLFFLHNTSCIYCLYIMELQMFMVVKNIENLNRKKLNLSKFQIL